MGIFGHFNGKKFIGGGVRIGTNAVVDIVGCVRLPRIERRTFTRPAPARACPELKVLRSMRGAPRTFRTTTRLPIGRLTGAAGRLVIMELAVVCSSGTAQM